MVYADPNPISARAAFELPWSKVPGRAFGCATRR